MPIPTSWLFTKGHESVWIYRLNASDLLICGPRRERLRCGFTDAKGLESYKPISPPISWPQAGNCWEKGTIGAAARALAHRPCARTGRGSVSDDIQ